MNSTAAKHSGAQSLPDCAPVPPPVEPTLYGDIRSYQNLLRRRTAPNDLQDTLLDQTLVDALSQLSVSSPHGAYQYGSGGYVNGSGLGVPVDCNGVDGRPFWLEQLGRLNMCNSDTKGVESCLLRDYVRNIASASGSGQPSNIYGNGFLPSPRLNQNGFLSNGGSCLACGGKPPRNRNVTSSYRNNNIEQNNQNNQRVYWLQEALSFEKIRGRMVAAAKDQQGCRVLQNVLDKGSRETIDMVFSEVIDRVTELMVDPFANYVVQKLVEVCNEEQRINMVERLVKLGFQVVNVCLNQYGGMAIQKLLEKTETYEPLSALIMALSSGTVVLMKDPYGHRVIQHCLKNFSAEHTKCILNAVIAHCFEVATDKSGCCVLQQCVECSNGEQRDHIVGEIIAHALRLAEDRYGNYVVQHILGLKDQRITANLLRQLEGSFVSLSCNKYGSNVVEKCLVESGENLSRRIVVELLENPNVSTLLVNNYGNYVIQSALLVSTGAYYNALVNLIRVHYPLMRNNLYGKRILGWFEKRKPPHVQQ